jgi:branched-chain amino acid transport system permease protein
MDKWLQLLVTGVTMGSIYALIALGFVTIYRTSRIVNMAQGSFVMFGALFAYSFLYELGLPFWLSGIIGVVLTVAIAVAMYVVVLKPILKVSLGAMILCTVALSLLFENAALLKWGGYGQGLPSFTGDQSFDLGGVFISRQSLWVIGIMVWCWWCCIS